MPRSEELALHLRVVALALVSLVAAAPVAAQDVVVTARVGDASTPAAAAADALAVQLTSRGTPPVTADVVRARLDARRPATLAAVPAELRDRLTRAATDALEAVARGRHPRVRELAEPVLREAVAHLASLGRDTTTERQLVDLCLFTVRSLLMQRDTAGARTRASECVRMVPGLEPSPAVHPGDVRALVEEVEHGAHATLELAAAPGDPTGCAIRVNGSVLGQTPSARASLPAGSYAVVTECAGTEPSGARNIDVPASGTARIALTVSLDRALAASTGTASLAYATPAELRDRATAHAASLAAAVGAQTALLVVSDDDGLRIERVRASDGAVTSRTRARLSGGRLATADATRALDALASGGDAGGGSPGSGRGSGRETASGSGSGGAGTDTGPRLVDASGGGGGHAILGPVILGTVGLALTGIVIGSLALSGCQDRYPEGDCMTERKIRPVEAILAASGAGLALAGAVIWFVVSGPSEDEENVRGVQVSVGPTGALVRGRF